MLTPYSDELSLALRVVHRVSLLTKSVLHSLKDDVASETKADDTIVTTVDFAAQALILSVIHAVYPDDSFIGEENAEALRQNDALAERVWDLVQRAAESEMAAKRELQPHERSTALAFPTSKDQMLAAIDMGASEQTRQGRVWTVDPIDGTNSFVTNKQYAVCLCLLVDGRQQVGVIACPNLQFDAGRGRIHEDMVDETGYGVVLSAVTGQGTTMRRMHATGFGEARRVERDPAPKEVSDLDFVETTIGKTSLSQDEHRAVAVQLGAQWPGTVLWSQQLKYVALALGATDVMVRLPKDKTRYTHIWDHAGGHILFQEAGGIIKDLDGGDIDFGQGRKIRGDRNFGMVAAMPTVIGGIMQAAKTVLERRSR